MNRREFLQALVAAGAVISLPVAIESVDAAQIDDTWQQLVEDPFDFEVGLSGTLIVADCLDPMVRSEIWSLGPTRTPEILVAQIESIQPMARDLRWHVYDEPECAEDKDEGWKDWVLAHAREAEEFANEWLNSSIEGDDWDWVEPAFCHS